MATLRVFLSLDVGDRVAVIDENGVEWSGVVSFNNKTFIQIRDGCTYWACDGYRLGYNRSTPAIPRIEIGTPEHLDQLADVGLLA